MRVCAYWARCASPMCLLLALSLPSTFIHLFIQHAGANQGVADGIGIAVATGPPVLQIALLFFGNTTRNTDADVSVGYASAKIVNVAGLAFAGQPTLVVLSSARIVRLNVPKVLLAKLIDRLLDLGDSILVAHRFR